MAHQTSTSKAATEPKEIFFEGQSELLSSSQFFELFNYVVANGKNTNSIENLSFPDAEVITLKSNFAPDIYSIYFIDCFPVAACDELSMITWTI